MQLLKDKPKKAGTIRLRKHLRTRNKTTNGQSIKETIFPLKHLANCLVNSSFRHTKLTKVDPAWPAGDSVFE